MKIIPALLFIIVLSACSTTCPEKIASTEIGITQAYSQAITLLQQEIISKETAKKVLVSIDSANALVDNARPLCSIDKPQATDYLTQASRALTDASLALGGN